MGALTNGFKRSTVKTRLVYEELVRRGPTRRDVLALATGFKKPTISVCLTKMKDAGLVRRTAHCVWAAVPVEEWPKDRGKWTGPTRSGPASPTWNGGSYPTPEGYIMVKADGNPMADCRGYVYEHRLVASQKLGRLLRSEEIVHHIDEDRGNNAPENLEVMSRAEHKVAHRRLDLGRRLPGERNPLISCACRCGNRFKRFDSYGRRRRFMSGHNKGNKRS